MKCLLHIKIFTEQLTRPFEVLVIIDYWIGLIFWFNKFSDPTPDRQCFKKNKFPSRMRYGVIEPMEEKSRLLRVSRFNPRISPSFLSEVTGPCSSCWLRPAADFGTLDAVRHRLTGQPVFPPLHALTGESTFLESSRKKQRL